MLHTGEIACLKAEGLAASTIAKKLNITLQSADNRTSASLRISDITGMVFDVRDVPILLQKSVASFFGR